MESLAPNLRPLFEAAGPALKYRIVRDLAGRDESYLETVAMRSEVENLSEVQAILAARRPDGSWDRSLAKTEFALCRLCELGLENTRAVDDSLQSAVLPALVGSDFSSEFPPTVARDILLSLITRASGELNPLVIAMTEAVLTEWERFPESGTAPPTLWSYAAIARYPWGDDASERVSNIVLKALTHMERHAPVDRFALRLCEKGEYLQHPEQLFYELELSARLGITHSCNATRWMFEEVESRQDADGWIRFEDTASVAQDGSPLLNSTLPWYFPLEPAHDPHLDWTFRAALVFKLLEYDF